MNNLDTEKAFFNDIVPRIRALVASFDTEISVAVHKEVTSDFATEVDVAVENLIVDEIQKKFPGDQILAEEGHSDVKIPDTRIWIIDPICGTNNLSRGINNFCTNIALADEGKVIAALVVDHSQDDHFWSVGNNAVFINQSVTKNQVEDRGVNVDVDLGCLPKLQSAAQKDSHLATISRLLDDTDYMLLSLNTSLSFAYIAVGKIDGAINLYSHPWDVAAASFLIQQAGGVITSLDGSPWTLASVGFIAAKNQSIHQTLLKARS